MRFSATKTASFALFLYLISAPLAEASNIDTIVSRLQTSYQKMKDYQASFTQETRIKAYPRPQISSGKVYYKRPGRMRWNYDKPEKQEIVTDGKTLWLYTPSLNQVIKSDFAAAGQSRVAMAFLSGMGNLKEDFIISLDEADNTKGYYRLILLPKDGNEPVKRVVLEVDKKSFQLKSSETTDLYDNVTIVTYSGYKTNSLLKDSLFDFVSPEGVEIFTPPNMH